MSEGSNANSIFIKGHLASFIDLIGFFCIHAGSVESFNEKRAVRHQISTMCTKDAALAACYNQMASVQLLSYHINWNFAPCVS